MEGEATGDRQMNALGGGDCYGIKVHKEKGWWLAGNNRTGEGGWR